jgi:hypothetical protein
VLTAPLHKKGSYWIVACLFVAAGIRLQSRCLAINAYSDFTIPAFRRHITISLATLQCLVADVLTANYLTLYFYSTCDFGLRDAGKHSRTRLLTGATVSATLIVTDTLNILITDGMFRPLYHNFY